jgi:hypothetical protein
VSASEKRLISWRTLQRYCIHRDNIRMGVGRRGWAPYKCLNWTSGNHNGDCRETNCPIWKRLPKPKGGTRGGE